MFDQLLQVSQVELTEDPNDRRRCVIFLRSGHTIKVPYSLREFMDLTRALRNSSAPMHFLVIDEAVINLDAIDVIEPVSRINRKEE